jgi:hypothetical protein
MEQENGQTALQVHNPYKGGGPSREEIATALIPDNQPMWG